MNDLTRHFYQDLYIHRPPVVNKYLQCLLIYDEHNALLGGTNMTDLLWNGTIWHCSDISDFSRDKADIMKEIEHGVYAAVYLEQDKFAIVGDSGVLEIFKLTRVTDEQPPELQSLNSTCQHDDSILTISKFYNKENVVTGGMDCCLKVWDVENFIAVYSYSFAHTDMVSSTDVKPASSSVFVSTSLNGESLLWDVRQSKPAHCIFGRDDFHMVSVTWNTVIDHLIAIGTDDGKIALIDMRQTGNVPLHESTKCNRGIYRLLFNPNTERKEQLACGSDDTSVKVFDSSKDMLPIFENNMHKDFVRGLAWYKDDLFTCAWDGKVIKNMIPASNDY